MQRVAWTDERLDDMSERMDAGFGRVGHDIRDLRSEMRSEIGGLRSDMREEIGGLRSEMQTEVGGLRGEMNEQNAGLRAEMQVGFAELRTLTWRFGGAIFGAVVISMILHGI